MKAPFKNVSILLLAVLLSCSKDEEVLPLTPGLITEIKAYDLDNNGSSIDIRVDFKVKDNLNVIEYRVMIVPESTRDSFDASVAQAVPRENFMTLFPESFEVEYSANRLSAGLPDVTGNPIVGGKSYLAVVLVIGTGTIQLFDQSVPIILEDRPIYEGYYEILVQDKIQTDLGCEEDKSDRYQTVLSFADGQYTGVLSCVEGETNCINKLLDQGDIFLNISGEDITFTYNRDFLCLYPTNLGDPCYSCQLGDPCDPASFAGAGKLSDEILMEINYIGTDCGGSHEASMRMLRVPREGD